MATDDLDAPLGQATSQDAKKRRRFQIPIAIPHMIAGLLALCLATFVGWALVVSYPLGGEPMSSRPRFREPKCRSWWRRRKARISTTARR